MGIQITPGVTTLYRVYYDNQLVAEINSTKTASETATLAYKRVGELLEDTSPIWEVRA